VDGWVRPDAWMDGHRPPAEYADDGTLGVVRLTHSRREDRITTLEMHHLVRDQSGIDHFVEHHVMAMTPTAEYVAAAESAGLGVRWKPTTCPDATASSRSGAPSRTQRINRTSTPKAGPTSLHARSAVSTGMPRIAAAARHDRSARLNRVRTSDRISAERHAISAV